MARTMILCTLPHRDPGSGEFERRNGKVTMAVINRAAIGLPYGRYPRLLLCWLTTEVVQQRSREIELGESFDAFMKGLGFRSRSGGPRGIRSGLREQIQRLFTSTISITVSEEGRWQDRGLRVADHIDLWWRPLDTLDSTSWTGRIMLSSAFFDAIADRPVPVAVHVLRALRSPFGIDLYCWLTYRMSYLRRPTVISWDALAEQFGHGYQRRCDFRKRLLRHLCAVQRLYAVEVREHEEGLELRPGATHVAMR